VVMKPAALVKWETGLHCRRYRLPFVSLITSSAIVAATASNALTSAFTGSDMVFHLLFEENCGFQ